MINRPLHFYSLFRRKLNARWLSIPAACLISAVVRGEDRPPVRSPPIMLKWAGILEKSYEPRQAATYEDAAVRSEVLRRFGRLLPGDLAESERKRLAALLQASDTSDGNAMEEALTPFPKADDLVFDGRAYAGANLGYIDAILGKSGRPIAFDRALPAMLVPITPATEAALVEKRSRFQGDDETRGIRIATARTVGEGAAAALFADGQYLRPYAGRFDDLYFHLFQNGNGASALAFCGLADGLEGRAYRPVNGLCRIDHAPAASFDLNDILSDGGKSAVRRYLAAQPDRGVRPFMGFAYRVLPSLIAKARTLSAGDRFVATSAETLEALRARQHFYPTNVPPLYPSPDRFLGWAGSFFVPVANAPALPPGAADSWYPLPHREGSAAGASTAEAAASARLFESSSTPDFVWEDPQLSNLLADPEKRSEPEKAPSSEPAPPALPSPKVDPDPRRRPANARLIVIVTPAAQEASDYLAAVAASDETLRTIDRARGRERLLRQFIESARASSPVATKGGGPAKMLDEVQELMAADIAACEQQETELAVRLQDALQARAELRSELENRLRRERVEPLQIPEKKVGGPQFGGTLKLDL